MTEDIHNFKKRLANSVETILGSKDFFEDDRNDLNRFYHFLMANNRNAGRIIKYLYHLKTTAVMLGKPFNTMNRDDIVELMSKVTVGKRKDGIEWSENTKRDFRVVFKRYYQWLKGYIDSEYPEEVKWIQTWLKNKVTKRPEDILNQEDIMKLANATENIRDRAFILTIGESGMRIGEFLTLKMKSLEFTDDGCDMKIISEKSLTARTVPVFTSVPALRDWINIHPQKDNQEAYLWVNFAGKRLAYGVVQRNLKRLSERCGITKRVNNHAFRHASATEDAKYLTENLLRQKYGWSRTSDMATFYIHLSPDDLRRKIKEVNNLKKSNGNAIILRKCFRCKESNDPGRGYCTNCNAPLDKKMFMQMNKLDDVIIKLLKAVAEEMPNVKEKFKEIVKEEDAFDIFND